MKEWIIQVKQKLFPQQSEVHLSQKLHHTHIGDFLDEQVNLQKKRVVIEQHKQELELENLYNDFHNYAAYCNQNIENLEKAYQKFIKLKRSEYEVRMQRLNNPAAIEHLETEYQNLITTKKTKIERIIDRINATREKKSQAISAKIHKFKQMQAAFLEEINHDAQVKITKLEAQKTTLTTQTAQFYQTRKTNLDTQHEQLRQAYQTDQTRLNDQLANHQIDVLTYETQQLNLNYQFVRKHTRLQNQANQSTWLIQKLRLGMFCQNFFQKEKILNYTTKTVKAANSSKLIIFFLIISLFTGVIFQSQYYSEQNWFGAILGSNVPIAFIALGETLVILTGGIDLSVGSMIGFGGTIYMSLVYSVGLHWLGSLIIMFIALFLIGYLSGFLISRLKIPPFIITLAGLLTLRGATTIILQGIPISSSTDPILSIFNYNIGGSFPAAILILIVVAVVLILFMKFAKFGRYVYAVGDNMQAAVYSGINSKHILNMVYLLSAVLAGFGALSSVAQINSVSPQTGATLELDAITAVALGGTSFAGGKGGLVKTLIGWFSISLLINALTFWGVDSNYQFVAKGIVIVIALIIDRDFNLFQRVKNYYYRALSYL
ncbi:ribose transport system permease protein [Mycoplasmoides fastidiosum]|uniref:Ribose transport system permease protein n=1 Tax=Mycoplasmoides fastidiosum TaxID=92758 RepID=A0ABU0LZU1_9BACT|nr:hypothetical protein [Mycoplasmoides fastidiosum]MDQ0514110.1 ribose transport system permease protein [Mycoplasmoides fastidiosum]UUD37482.1 hypothetical protein NPA10_02830 [Mycoplasmoides fastidiosum]